MINTQTGTQTVNELVRAVKEKRLVPDPPFQRRQVWTAAVRDHFLETVRLGLPFPEIFIVTGQIDPATHNQVDHLVDGQQRMSALVAYVDGSEEITYEKVRRYAELDSEEQKQFLQYPVAVRKLAHVDDATVADIFNRINSTDYPLKATERYNALFTGDYRKYCEALAEHEFFERHRTFTRADWKRMGDMTFTLTLVTTLLAGYFRREEELADYLERFDNDFPEADAVTTQLNAAFGFVDACRFPAKCRVWKKTDLYTLLVEACFVTRTQKATLDPAAAGPRLAGFYAAVDDLYSADPSGESASARSVPDNVLRYMKAATKATNDKYARVARSEVILPLLVGEPKPRPTGKRK